jgi:peptidoglycan/LPS O-acetylase OafA/YrhL
VIFAISPGAFTGPYELVCVLLLLPALVVMGVSVEPGRRLKPAFAFLGVTSYGVYSMHFPLALAAEGALRSVVHAGEDLLAPWSGFAFIGVLLIGVSLVDKLYDTPVRKRLTALLGPGVRQEAGLKAAKPRAAPHS